MIQAGAVELKEEQKDGKAKTNCQQIGQDIDTDKGTKIDKLFTGMYSHRYIDEKTHRNINSKTTNE